jgi:Dolichyl-phosphate-mannose-protein mannosyltransferase
MATAPITAPTNRLSVVESIDVASEPSLRRSSSRLVLAVTVVAAMAATAWSATTHSLLIYGDSRAHLDVARHVTDALTPGLVQLGSVWLPLPHILLVPLVAIRPLWHSGAAGAIVGGVCFIYATSRMYALVIELTENRVAAWCSVFVLVANLNLLYLQTTALTEPVLLAFMVGAVYHLAVWMRTLSVRSLMWCALLTLGATLSRYEGWPFLVGIVGIVLLWSLRHDRRKKAPEANVVFVGILGGYGIALWLVYNLVIFHDALYWMHSAYSAHAIDGKGVRFGMLATKGDVVDSVLTYGWAVLGIVGVPVLAISGIAVLVVAVRRSLERERSLLVLLGLFVPVAFGVTALFLGQETIRVPQHAPYGMYNIRYALVALPVCAAAIGLMVARVRWSAVLAIAGVVATAVIMAIATPIALADGQSGISSATAGHPERAAAFLHAHYRGGEVLADDAASATFIFASDLDLDQFVTVGFHPYWERAMTEPAKHVRWLATVPGDAVDINMKRHPERFKEFRLVKRDGRMRIYQRSSVSLAHPSTKSAIARAPGADVGDRLRS